MMEMQAHGVRQRQEPQMTDMLDKLEKGAEFFWAKVAITRPNDCWPYRGCKDNCGYGWLTFNKKQMRASRLAWMIQNKSAVPVRKFVLHTCDNPSCCNPAHLYVGTQKDNMRDALLRGRYRTVFTPAQVRDIYAKTQRGITSASLARHYGVSDSAVRAIKRGERWQHLIRK